MTKQLLIKDALVLMALILSPILAGCRIINSDLSIASARDTAGESSSPTNTPKSQTLTIYAATSLTDAFKEIGLLFESINAGVKVNFNFAGSQMLRTQIEQGAVVDIFASADQSNMDLLISENLILSGSIHEFASNHLIVILPPGNPAGIETLQDITNPDVKLVLVDNSVPAGNYTRRVLTNLSMDPEFGVDFSTTVMENVVSNETDVRQVVTKVELGEADAGFVYASDAVAAPALATITIPYEFNIIAHYPITILNNSSNPELAGEFLTYLLSTTGQAIISKWGFSPGQ